MSYELITAFVVFAFVASITPGPNNVMLMASGANFGFARTIPHMLGIVIGFTLMVIAVGFGLMGVFNALPIFYQGLKAVCIGYLFYLAWKIARAAPPDESQEKGTPFTFMQAALFQWVNPKAVAMSVTAISAYTSPAHPVSGVLVTAIIFGLVNLPSISVWVVMGTQARYFLTAPVRLRAFNVVMAGLLVLSVLPILFLE